MSATGRQGPQPPNVVLVLADDMGFSDLGCYGSEIATPNLDAIAQQGLRMSQFYNTARCSPARASLLTGLHPHQTGIGVLTRNDGPGGYAGTINDRCVTMAEVLRDHGYATAMVGKWHLAGEVSVPNDAWPTRRGFDHFFGTLAGSAHYYQPVTLTRGEEPASGPNWEQPDLPEDFYLTEALGDEAAEFVAEQSKRDTPYLLYLPFTAPHWPLHAPEEVVVRYLDVYRAGWDVLRGERHRRQCELGLFTTQQELSDRDPEIVPWAGVADQEWQARRMAVYAAQVELLDAAVGKVVEAIRHAGQWENTLFLFCSDNGGCAEEFPPAWIDELDPQPYHTPRRTRDGRRVRRGNDSSVVPGGPESFASYGKPWANLSNTPFREYKHWVHEGGIATPFIAHWPSGNLPTGWNHHPHQLPDVLATVLEATGTPYPNQWPGRDLQPLEGRSMIPSWQGNPRHTHPLFFEHEGNCAVRDGQWKLVRKFSNSWELYDIDADRAERIDLAPQRPALVRELANLWQAWADRCGVLPREQVLATGQDRITMLSTYRSTHRQH